jgi:uncharacterized protein (TIGR00661 family)
MRVLYGVGGYGHGHATRAACVVPRLAQRHQVLVLAGGDARAALEPVHSVFPIPALGLAHCGPRPGPLGALARDASGLADALLGGPARRRVEDLMRAFKPDVVISDAEAFTHRAAARLRVPRIAFDHSGLLAHARLEAPPHRRLHLACAAATYRLLMGRPDRVVVSSFFEALPRRPGVAWVPTLLRPDVLCAAPQRGDHLLVCLDQVHRPLPLRMERELQALGVPSIVYGVSHRGQDGLITFHEPDRARFVADLASCRAVLSTAASQLVGEAMHLGKALFVVADGSAEQLVTALAVERLGLGRWAPGDALDRYLLQAFLAQADVRGARGRRLSRDGTDAAVAALERFARELSRRASPRRAA